MGVEIEFDQKVRDSVLAGVETLADAVQQTLGPKGRNVIIGSFTEDPKVTKDGVTVAKSIELTDPLENIGATLVKRVAEKSNDYAGDGTTTATVLARGFLKEGLKLVAAGHDPVEIKQGIDSAVSAILYELNEMAVKIKHDSEMVQSIATISANNDESIGSIIAEAFKTVGENGAVSVEEGGGYETKVSSVEGLQFDRGMASTYFSSSPDKAEVTFKDPFILIADGKVNQAKQVISTLEAVAPSGRPLLIIAETIEGQALQTLIVNKMRGGLEIAAVRTPGFGSYRATLARDIAAVVGAKVVPNDRLEEVSSEYTAQLLGTARMVTITDRSTVIMGGVKDEEDMKSIIEKIDKDLKDPAILQADKDRMAERKARLTGGVAVIEVGAASEVDMKEKKDRVDDAKEAVISAIEEGVVIGGGMALINACKKAKINVAQNTAQKYGVDIVRKSIEYPFRAICENAGVNADVVLNEINSRPEGTGYNAKTGQYVEMFDEGILDPKKVTRIALESAASVSGTLLTTSCAVIPKE